MELRAGSVGESVDVWWAATDGDVEWSEEVLSRQELRRAERMAPAAAERFVRSRVLLRRVLGRYLDRRPAELAFSTRCRHCGDESHGRPFLADGGPDFSLSRTDGMAVVAVADRPVGVDVERDDRLRDAEAVSKAALSAAELADLGQRPGSQRAQRVLDAWTKKEAYLKGLGIGLAGDPRQVEFEAPDAAGWQRVRDRSGSGQGSWWLRPIGTNPGFVAALAVPRRPLKVREYDRSSLPA
jgi:4'-phosphopantetheinyl transferase